jgi:VanZ family protein
VFIFLLAILPINGTNSFLNHNYILEIRFDYVTHFVVFILMMWLVWNAYEVRYRKNLIEALLWVFFGLIVAFLSEGLQYFVPYRAYNINDLVANGIGVVLGGMLFFLPETKRIPSPQITRINAD